MADNTSSQVNRNTIYDYRGNGAVTTMPINPTASGGHTLQQGVDKGIGVPTQSIFSDNASAGISGAEAATGQTTKSYPNLAVPFGRASNSLLAVGLLNDGVNVAQHIKADRYREASVEFGGAAGQFGGGLGGGSIGELIFTGVFGTNPLTRIVGAGFGGYFGARGLGEIGKDAIRHFTAPSLPADLDLKPNVVIDGQGYAAVRVEDKIVWYRIIPPEAPDDLAEAAADPVSVRVPDTRETYMAVTNPTAVNQLTDRFLQQHLPPVDYERYRQDMAVLRQTQELLQEKNPPQLVDGEWVRVQVTPSDVPDDPRGDGATVDRSPVTPQEAWLLNRTREIQTNPGGNPGSLAPGFGPDGAPLNVWQENGSSNPRYLWVQSSDGELIKVTDQRNGQVTEQRLDPGSGQLNFVREFDSATRPPRVTLDHRPAVDSPDTADSYIVQRNDTLWDIAQRHGTTVAAIVEANPQLALNPDLVHTNQRLTIPGLGLTRGLEGQMDSAGENVFDNSNPAASPPPVTPSPRFDENGMPLPEIKEGAAYDPNTDPVYKLLLDTIREAQASDQSIPADAVQVADAGTTMSDAGQGYGPADPNAPPADGIAPAPEAPTILGPNFGDGATADPLAPNYSFNTPPAEQTWYRGENATANSYAQGVQSAVSFIQALQQGNEFSAALSGMSMLNAFGRAAGISPADLPFSQTTTAGLGGVSAALNLRDALRADDNFAALVAGTNLVTQVGTAWLAATNSAFASGTQSLAQASPVINGFGQAAGVLGIANSLRQGDELGAAIGVIMMVNPVLGIALSVARALFGGDDPPEPRGTAEVQWNADGSLRVAVTEDDDGGGQSAQGMMQSMLDTLNGYLGQQTDAHGDPSFALIPQRLPTVSFFQREYAEFMLNYTESANASSLSRGPRLGPIGDENGQRVSRHYNGQGQQRMSRFLLPIQKAYRTVAVTVIVLSFYGCGTGYVTQAVSEIAVRSTFPQSIGALTDITRVDIIDSAGSRSHRIDAATCSLWADALVGFINDRRNNWYLARVNLAPGAASPEPRGRFRIVFWQGDGQARVISFEDRRMETNHQGAVLYSQLNVEYAATLHVMLFPKEEQWLVDRNTQVPCARPVSSAVSVLALAA